MTTQVAREKQAAPVPVAIRATGSPTRRIASSVRGVRIRLLASAGLGSLATLCAIGLLATSGWLISRASQMPSIIFVQVAIVAVRAFGLGRGFFRYGERLLSHDAAFRALTNIRVAIFNCLERLAPQGLAVFRRGDLLSLLISDVDATQDLSLRVFLPTAAALLAGTVSVAVTWWLLPAAGCALLIALVVGATVVPWLSVRLASGSVSGSVHERAALATQVADLLRGTADVIACGAVQEALDQCRQTDTRLTTQARRSAYTFGVGSALSVLISGGAVVAALVAGIPAVRDGRLDGVNLAVVVLLPLAAYEAVASLPAAALAWVNVRTSSQRLVDVVDTPPPVSEPTSPQVIPAGGVTVAIDQVEARWAGGERAALDGIDLVLTPGSRVAVVGASGAGKTTLVSVLLRFIEYSGHITVNGVELSDASGDDVRRLIGLCGQDAHIFDSSIAANLRVAKPDATDQELRDVIARARLSDWVDSLPEGWATYVGEHGSRISGGQRQRIALARALLADFPVLLLDEPAEHLDWRTADELTADLLASTHGRTTLLVTHRLRGLEDVDEIVVLDGGRIVERGTHRELIDGQGVYLRLWQRESAAVAAALM